MWTWRVALAMTVVKQAVKQAEELPVAEWAAMVAQAVMAVAMAACCDLF